MIISDKYQFAFVHIPKCAGTTVRTPLQRMDDCDGFFTSRVDHHPDLGLLDYVHIPLFTLRDYFSSEFEKVQNYWSFAVMRDPHSRFASSISQRLKKYRNQPIQNCSAVEIKEEIKRSIDFLENQLRYNHHLPAEYIHFQKQVDYILLDGKQIVDDLYTVDEVDLLLAAVSKRVGCNLCAGGNDGQMPQDNRSMVYRNELFRLLMKSTRPVTRLAARTLSENSRQKLRNMIYIRRDQRLESVFSSDYVQDFIQNYYQDDIALWNEIRLTSIDADEQQV